MIYLANHIPSEKVEQVLVGNFFYKNSIIILSSNTIYLFYPETKLVKRKFFYEKIIQIEKQEAPEKDLLILLFEDNRISYLYYDKQINNFVSYLLKFYEIENKFLYHKENSFIKKGKFHSLIKLNKYNYSFLSEKTIYKFTDLNKNMKNIKDILVTDSYYKCFYVLTDEALYLVSENAVDTFILEEECIKLLKGRSFICVIGKYNLFLLKNKLFFKIEGNKMKLNFLNEKIINKINKKNNPSLCISNKVRNNEEMDIDFGNAFFSVVDDIIYILYNNILYEIKVIQNNHKITFLEYYAKTVSLKDQIYYFFANETNFIINDHLFDKFLSSSNKFLTNELTFSEIQNFNEILCMNTKYNKEDQSYLGDDLLLLRNYFVFWVDKSSNIIKKYAHFKGFPQKIDFVFINDNAFINSINDKSIINNKNDNTFINSIINNNNSDNNIKEILGNNDFILLITDNQFFLYRIINNDLLRITNNTLPMLSEYSILENKEYLIIKSNPMVYFNKNNFIIKEIKKEKEINNLKYISENKEGIIKVKTEESTFFIEKIKEENEESEEEEIIDLGSKTKRFFIQYYSLYKENEYFINEFELLEDEFVTEIKKMELNDLQSKNNKSNFLVVTTSFVKSEEGLFKGRILLFEVINVVKEENKPWTDRRLKILAIEKAKGSVMDCCEVRGLIACCVGTKLLIYEIDRNEGLNCIAFHDTNILCVKVRSIKNYLAVGDLNGILFFYFQSKPAKIHLLNSELVYAKDVNLLVKDDKLFILVTDLSKVKVFTYSPYNILSKEGQYLIKRSEISLLVNYDINIINDNKIISYYDLYIRIINGINCTGGIDLKYSLLNTNDLITKRMLINELFYEFINYDYQRIKEITKEYGINELIELIRKIN